MLELNSGIAIKRCPSTESVHAILEHSTLSTELTHESSARFLRPAPLRRVQARAGHAGRRRSCSRENRALIERVAAPGVPATWRDFVRAAGGRERAPAPRVGRRRAPERRDEQPRAARGLQREPAQGHPVLHRARPAPGAVRASSRRCAASPRVRAASRARSARSWRTSCATSGWAAPSCRPTKKARFKAIRERLSQLSSRFSDNLLDATNAFAHYVTDAARGRRHPGGRAAGGARSGAGGGQAGLEIHAARAVLPAGACSTPTTAALRELMYRAYVTRASEFGKPEWDNTPLIAEIVKLRARAGAAARLRELRRVFARAQDGGVAAAGARVPGRARRAREALRRARPARS